MSETEEHDFIKEFVTWMKGPGFRFQSLHIYNFGYERSLPLPSVAIDGSSNLQTLGMQTPSKWSLVIIGEKVPRFLALMTTIDRIHEDTQALPLAVFVQTEDDLMIRNISSHVTPTLVNVLLTSLVKSSKFTQKFQGEQKVPGYYILVPFYQPCILLFIFDLGSHSTKKVLSKFCV